MIECMVMVNHHISNSQSILKCKNENVYDDKYNKLLAQISWWYKRKDSKSVNSHFSYFQRISSSISFYDATYIAVTSIRSPRNYTETQKAIGKWITWANTRRKTFLKKCLVCKNIFQKHDALTKKRFCVPENGDLTVERKMQADVRFFATCADCET